MKVIYLVMNKISYCLPSVHCALRLFLLLSFWSLDEHFVQCIGEKLYCQFKQILTKFGTCISLTISCATFITSSTEFSSPSFTHLSLVEAIYWHTEKKGVLKKSIFWNFQDTLRKMGF